MRKETAYGGRTLRRPKFPNFLSPQLPFDEMLPDKLGRRLGYFRDGLRDSFSSMSRCRLLVSKIHVTLKGSSQYTLTTAGVEQIVQ